MRARHAVVSQNMAGCAWCVLSVQPVSSLIDDKVKIIASELRPKQNITLEARIVGDKGEVFESHAYFIVDKDAVSRLWEDLTAEFHPWDCYGA